MNNVITTDTIKQGGGGITNPEHKDGKINIGKSPLKVRRGKKQCLHFIVSLSTMVTTTSDPTLLCIII